MKNILGHDDNSEILTLISRMREDKFIILNCDSDLIQFEITLTYKRSVPVPNTSHQKIKYLIGREYYNYTYRYIIKQIDGKESREIPLVDGHAIWSLLEGKLIEENIK
jgi:hypothetical protein